MRVTVLLADSAQAVGGKLFILGAGWDRVPAPTPPIALALLVMVPWDQTNKRHTLAIELVDGDGQPVTVPTPVGDHPLVLKNEFEVGRPAGMKPGSDSHVPMAANFPSLPLRPDTRYTWRVSIDDETRDDWQVSFTTMPAKAAPERA